ncbi:MAG TPA: 2-oxoglutarate dehydrogenase E1 component, partial [Geobacterales bacterium]|nr:2-oxoglutarate dehydrogenase E1 component [Geobacterales bacterium]
MAFLGNVSPGWLENEYLRWQRLPESVSSEWQQFFAGYDLAASLPATAGDVAPLRLQLGLHLLVSRYRELGHLMACTDPLSPCRLTHPLLDLSQFGLEESDLERSVQLPELFPTPVPLRQIVDRLRQIYCHEVGVEYLHIQEPKEREWLRQRLEGETLPRLSPAERVDIFEQLAEAALFEAFLHRRFVGQRRFSLEGGEGLIPVLDQIVRHGASLGITDLILGMPHRGRLNVLAHIFAKPYEAIFAEFEDNLELGFVGDGDVKYHKGLSRELHLADGRTLHLTMASNPSHLEAVNPVVEGKCRARQDRLGESAASQVLPILIHGDASFAGQGVVAETLNLSGLEGYRTGGTLHLVLNNQIGFTTLPKDARSTFYATDVAKMLMIPIFHVQGEEPEALLRVARLALEYRQTFGRDVVVEIICYRRHGHNEGDEPYFTQPLMYEQIRNRPPVHRIYGDRLLEEGVPEVALAAVEERISARLEEAHGKKALPVSVGFDGRWQGVGRDYQPGPFVTTVAADTLTKLAEQITSLPDGFTLHPKVAALLQRRRQQAAEGQGIDWGTAEALAFGSLLAQGVMVRLSGQDSRRGTFNHRHATHFDQVTGESLTPLAGVAAKGSPFHVFDSMLSEYAVLGFEYGYSLETADGLVIWEAQFGDFANGAQVVIDQFIAAGESKWDRVSALVLLLPHGYEGMGAEHSSARIERYLQLCARNNLQIVYPSTPAQLFHLLRGQVIQPFRKPLVVFTPKSLLRHPACVSTLQELSEGGFQQLISDPLQPQKVHRVVLCSGKLYYDLQAARQERGVQGVALVRLEQFYPFQAEPLQGLVSQYGPTVQWLWAQEEPANMGGWSFLKDRLAEVVGKPLRYVGRAEDAAPAVGSHRQ